MNKGLLKITSGLLLFSFLAYTTPIFAFSKEETVYSKTKPDGENYKTIVSTHLINNNKEEILKDLSDLINIENVNGDETFTQNGEELSWSANGSDIYYQGESKKELPIKTTIKYELNGKEVTSDEIAGKNGKVKIKISYENLDKHLVSINGKTVSMYTPFTVITGTIFDNTKCRNVEVSTGKVVNDGTKTIVMGISMPGMQESLNISKNTIEIPSSIEITMDAEGYEQKNMITFVTPKVFEEQISFNKLNTLYSKINEVQNASKKIEEGANTLKDGVNAAYEGANTIKTEVANSLNANSAALDEETLNQIKAQAATGATLSDAQKQAIADQAAQGATLTNEQLNAIANQALAGVGTVNAQLTENQIAGIKQQADNAIDTTYSQSIKEGARDQVDELLSGVTTQITAGLTAENVMAASGNNVSEAVATAIASNLSNSMTTSISNSKTQIYTSAETKAIASAKQIAENSSVTAAQAAATQAAQTAAEAAASQTAKVVAQNPASQTASKTAAAVAQSTATKVAEQAQEKVAEKMVALNNGLGQLTDGLKQLSDGSVELANGITQFNTEAIDKICGYVNNNVKDITKRLEKLQELSQEYANFSKSQDETKGEVKFILVTDAIKVKEEKEEN